MWIPQFSAQVERLVDLGYPTLLDMGSSDFRRALDPLVQHLKPGGYTDFSTDKGIVPFVIVISSGAVPVERTLSLVWRGGKAAIERLYPKTHGDFKAINAVQIPTGHAYLAVDIDRGKELVNVTPDAALASIEAHGRSPLTIDEGIALLTHFPEFLQPNNCFSLLASRCGDRRVPAFWLSEGHPKLGWCWAGNPHTWLGSASCASRIESVQFPLMAYDQ
jgi:hypothetical protein